MTLVLGAPGCGKTTLFKVFYSYIHSPTTNIFLISFEVLANHGAKKKKTQTGQVLFNGQLPSRKTHHQAVAYVTQEDTHFRMFFLYDCVVKCIDVLLATLTVRETLQFSLNCQAPQDMPENAKEERVR